MSGKMEREREIGGEGRGKVHERMKDTVKWEKET